MSWLDEAIKLVAEFTADGDRSVSAPRHRIRLANALQAAEQRGAQQMRERAARVADDHPDSGNCRFRDFDDPEILRGCCEVIASTIRALPDRGAV